MTIIDTDLFYWATLYSFKLRIKNLAF